MVMFFLDNVIHPSTGRIIGTKGGRVTKSVLQDCRDAGIIYVPMVGALAERTDIEGSDYVQKYSPYDTEF
jgi:hypothetical protein